MIPTLLWSNRQRTVRLELPKIRRIVEVVGVCMPGVLNS